MHPARVSPLLLWLVLFAPAPASAQERETSATAPNSAETSVRARDQAAIDAYRRGDLDSARSLWIAELESDTAGGAAATDAERVGDTLSTAERARMLYDLGNVAYRKKQILESVGWYSAALRLSPRDPDIWWNLEHARSEAKLEPADRGDLSGTLWRLLSSFTRAESEWFVLGTLALWSVTLALEALRGGRVWRRLSLAGAALVLWSLGPWLFHLQRDAEHPLLAIQEGKLEVRSEPRLGAPVIAEVAAGEQVEALDALPEWRKIELPSGVQGWARNKGLFDLVR